MQRTLYRVLTVKTQHKPYCGPPAALYVVLRPLICLWTPSRWLPAACTAPVSPSAAGPAPPPSSELYSAPMQDGGRWRRIRRGKGGVKGAKEIHVHYCTCTCTCTLKRDTVLRFSPTATSVAQRRPLPAAYPAMHAGHSPGCSPG